MDAPQLHYATSLDGTSIAYAAHPGPDRVPLLQISSLAFSHAQMEWSLPSYRGWFEALSTERPVIRFDHRGAGLSDRSPADRSLEAHLADAIAVLDALGLEQVHVFGPSLGSMLAIALAAKVPSRVLSMTLWNPMLRYQPANAVIEAALLAIAGEDIDLYFRINAGSVTGWGHSAESQDAIFRFGKASVTREDWLGQRATWNTYDVSAGATLVRCPTLITVAASPAAALGPAREVAKAIPGSRLLPCDGVPRHMLNLTDDAERAFMAFMREHEPEGEPAAAAVLPSESPATFRTILFTDIEGHTSMMERLGDMKGRAVLREHERITRAALAANGGSEVKTMGDGFLASFVSAQQALACAISLQRAFAAREGEPVKVRVGVNAGEPIAEEDDLFGASVIAAARIAAKASGGEVLVSDVVRQIVAGKGFLFHDTGEHALRGMEDPVRIWELRWEADRVH
jgi:class 3 adenylate cyclase